MPIQYRLGILPKQITHMKEFYQLSHRGAILGLATIILGIMIFHDCHYDTATMNYKTETSIQKILDDENFLISSR